MHTAREDALSVVAGGYNTQRCTDEGSQGRRRHTNRRCTGFVLLLLFFLLEATQLAFELFHFVVKVVVVVVNDVFLFLLVVFFKKPKTNVM